MATTSKASRKFAGKAAKAAKAGTAQQCIVIVPEGTVDMRKFASETTLESFVAGTTSKGLTEMREHVESGKRITDGSFLNNGPLAAQVLLLLSNFSLQGGKEMREYRDSLQFLHSTMFGPIFSFVTDDLLVTQSESKSGIKNWYFRSMNKLEVRRVSCSLGDLFEAIFANGGRVIANLPRGYCAVALGGDFSKVPEKSLGFNGDPRGFFDIFHEFLQLLGNTETQLHKAGLCGSQIEAQLKMGSKEALEVDAVYARFYQISGPMIALLRGWCDILQHGDIYNSIGWTTTYISEPFALDNPREYNEYCRMRHVLGRDFFSYLFCEKQISPEHLKEFGNLPVQFYQIRRTSRNSDNSTARRLAEFGSVELSC